jgi:DNA polymerase-1
VAKCAGCPYSGPAIGTDGNPEAQFVICGEAPGAQELRTGKPFVGPSGEMLWRTLGRHGVTRDMCLITNALKCRPDNGEMPSPEAIKACRSQLMDELTEHPRRVILALGNTAVRSISDDQKLKITQIHGRARKMADPRSNGEAVIPTLHPAAVLRQNGFFKAMAADMAYAAQVYHDGAVRDPGESKWILISDPERVREAVDRLMRYPVLSADIETGGFDRKNDKVLCIGISWERNKVAIFPHEVIPLLKPLLECLTIRWIWHFGKFDVAFFNDQYGIRARVDEDTGLLSYTLNEQGGIHDLEQIASSLLGADDYKGVVKKYASAKAEGFSRVPKRILYPYLAKDADYPFQIYDVYRPKVSAVPSLDRLYRETLIPANEFLRKVESRGIYIDSVAIEGLRETLEEERSELLAELTTLAEPYWDENAYTRETRLNVSNGFSPDSPYHLTWVIYSRMGLRPSKRVAWNTREETLSLLPQTAFIKGILRLRDVSKSLKTYVLGILRRMDPVTARVYTTYLLHGSVTGRLASRNPNVQNITRPPDTRVVKAINDFVLELMATPDDETIIRDIFAAPPGRMFMEADYNQAELRVLASLSGDEWLTNVYREGRNLHDEVSKYFYGPDYTIFQKIRAKAINFGIAYGRGEGSIAFEHNIPRPEARRLIDEWFARMPDAHKFILQCRGAVQKGKALETVFGRRRRFGLVTPENLHQLQNEASNFPISSTASDLNLTAAMEADAELQSMGVDIINLVHDSILMELPEDPSLARRAFELVRKHMLEVPRRMLGDDVPFAVEVKIGRRWGMMAEVKVD